MLFSSPQKYTFDSRNCLVNKQYVRRRNQINCSTKKHYDPAKKKMKKVLKKYSFKQALRDMLKEVSIDHNVPVSIDDLIM